VQRPQVGADRARGAGLLRRARGGAAQSARYLRVQARRRRAVQQRAPAARVRQPRGRGAAEGGRGDTHCFCSCKTSSSATLKRVSVPRGGTVLGRWGVGAVGWGWGGAGMAGAHGMAPRTRWRERRCSASSCSSKSTCRNGAVRPQQRGGGGGGGRGSGVALPCFLLTPCRRDGAAPVPCPCGARRECTQRTRGRTGTTTRAAA
jgi:hypothetical protein